MRAILLVTILSACGGVTGDPRAELVGVYWFTRNPDAFPRSREYMGAQKARCSWDGESVSVEVTGEIAGFELHRLRLDVGGTISAFPSTDVDPSTMHAWDSYSTPLDIAGFIDGSGCSVDSARTHWQADGNALSFTIGEAGSGVGALGCTAIDARSFGLSYLAVRGCQRSP